MFSPLPGYLLNQSNHLGAILAAGVFFIFLSLIESVLYWNLWSRKELLYLNYIAGKHRALGHHGICFIFSRILFFIVAFGAFVKVSVSIASIMYLLACYLLLMASFVTVYQLKMNLFVGPIRFYKLLLDIKLVMLCLTIGVKVRMLLVAIVLMLSMVLQQQGMTFEPLYYYLIVFLLLILFLFHSLFKLVNINLEQNKIFLKSINLNLYVKYKQRLRWMVLALFVLSVLLNFQSMIQDAYDLLID